MVWGKVVPQRFCSITLLISIKYLWCVQQFCWFSARLDLSAIDVSRWIMRSVVWPFRNIFQVSLVCQMLSLVQHQIWKHHKWKTFKYPNKPLTYASPLCYFSLWEWPRFSMSTCTYRLFSFFFFFFSNIQRESSAATSAANKQSKNSWDTRPTQNSHCQLWSTKLSPSYLFSLC